jgi:hypothetical protein
MSRIDFSALLKPVRFDAAAGQPDQAGGTAQARAGFLTRTNRRRMACLKEARDALPLLPDDGETLHGIMTGTYDLMHLLIVLLDRLDSTCTQLRIATLSLSARNVAEMAALLDAGTVRRLDLLCSDFFRKHDKGIFAEMLQELTSRGQRVAAARSHCKIVTLALADGRRFTLEGSANLRTNKNQEQFALTQDAALHDWYAAWIDLTVKTHEVRQGEGEAEAHQGEGEVNPGGGAAAG